MTSRVFVVASVLAGTALGAIHPLVLAAWRRGDVDDSSDSDGDDDGINDVHLHSGCYYAGRLCISVACPALGGA